MSSHITGLTEDGSSGEFGANEWLVDEMYESFLADRDSVDRSWWPILENYHQIKTTGAIPTATPEPTPEPAPEPAPEPSPAHPATQPVARTTSIAPKAQPIPADAPKTQPVENGEGEEADATPEKTVQTLKGMSKSLAANMDASLTVPTATSVRTMPAKLLIDNRIVINNHLKRARGGKVSFTHLIGWALVQAIKDFPSQNVYYEEVDGKP